LKPSAPRFQSTSVSATTFSTPASEATRSWNGRPPAPMPAIFSFSLGDLYPSAFSDWVLPKPPCGTAPASSDPKKKYLRETR